MKMREDVKKQLPPNAKVTDIVRAIAHEWSLQTEEQRRPWEEAAALDKQRYEDEMATYEGPLRIPNKRLKKQVETPKRVTTAFTYFSQDMRQQWKAQDPTLAPPDISKKLSDLWAHPQFNKQPYMDQESRDRERYEREMMAWSQRQPPGLPVAGLSTHTNGQQHLHPIITNTATTQPMETHPTPVYEPWQVPPSLDTWLHLDPNDTAMPTSYAFPTPAMPMNGHFYSESTPSSSAYLLPPEFS